jgi:hypothetical protein
VSWFSIVSVVDHIIPNQSPQSFGMQIPYLSMVRMRKAWHLNMTLLEDFVGMIDIFVMVFGCDCDRYLSVDMDD